MALKRVLLFSCGLDSYIMKKVHNFSDEECLFVDLHTEENNVEIEKICQFFPKVNKEQFPLNQFELPNKIIPFRNHHLALIAANYAPNIYFAFTAGDSTKDKDFVFKAQMEGILNYFGQASDKVHIQPPFSIEIPFKTYTKTELVFMYIQNGFSVENLLNESCSCYDGGEKPCGKCRSCLRKFIALYLNGVNLSTSNHWETSPIPYLLSFYNESLLKERNQKEIKEIEQCLKTLKLQ